VGYVSYKAKAPGSLMLLGEHAVLHNKLALVAAINRYIKVKLVPNRDPRDTHIKIVSQNFGSYATTLGKFKIVKPYAYVLTAISQYLTKIKTGFTLIIEAEFPSNIGLGSSAAITTATLGVLHKWLRINFNLRKLYKDGARVVRLVQGCGSGADIAASVFGGIVVYKLQPLTITKLNKILPLVAIYSGNKVPTPQVVAEVENRRKGNPFIFKKLYSAIESCTKAAMVAIKNNNFILLGEIMNIHQGLHDALGVNNSTLANMIFALRKEPEIYGAKISGSGLGDCVIGLGKITHKRNEELTDKLRIDIAVSREGMTFVI